MDKRGQSALEYLMTYGWALIVIAIVIGVLIYVTSSSAGGVTCQSKSNQFIIDAYVVGAGLNNVDMTLRNATGKTVTAISATGMGNFNGVADDLSSQTIVKNATFNLTNVDGPVTGTTFTDGAVQVSVTIGGTLTSDFNVVCAGSV